MNHAAIVMRRANFQEFEIIEKEVWHHMISSHRLAPGTVHRTFHSLLTPSLTGFSVNSFVGGSLLPLLCHGPRLVEEKTSWFMESTCPSLRKNLLFIQFILVQLRELSTALALSVPLGSLPCVSFKFRKAASATFRNGWTRSDFQCPTTMLKFWRLPESLTDAPGSTYY